MCVKFSSNFNLNNFYPYLSFPSQSTVFLYLWTFSELHTDPLTYVISSKSGSPYYRRL